ncbi:MAG TPA: pirin family protein [Pseudonocardiaceae bacterium]|nr:pirin family protein [Pseudonocardiaceae bacterium]
MSNIEADPAEVTCRPTSGSAGPSVEVLQPRAVPLGGPRAMTVRRTLPQRSRSLIGAWCFADHYGPDDVRAGGGMDVAPHPHTGLQTVSWLFAGEVEHRDSLGTHALIRPGELNLMTGGHGICHCEVSTPDTAVLHGVQLWVALPNADRDAPRDFQHYAPESAELDGATVRVFLGRLAGQISPVRTYTPLLGAEIVLAPGAHVTLDVDPAFEHGVLVDTNRIDLTGAGLIAGELGRIGVGAREMSLVNPTDRASRVVVLGGPPFGEEIVMWWNFVGRSHDEIAGFRDDWQQESERFGRVTGYPGDRLPAPPLPGGKLRPRGNP